MCVKYYTEGHILYQKSKWKNSGVSIFEEGKAKFINKQGDPFPFFEIEKPHTMSHMPLHLNSPVKYRPIYRS